MARPKKTGLDYFSIDVDFFQNIKVRKIKMACGAQSTSVLICLLCNIYRNKGYYIKWDKDLPFLIADEVGVSEGAALEIINKAVQVGFFNKSMFELGVLTSKEIQERYVKACKDSKRTNIEIRKELDLLGISSVNTPEETSLTPEETNKTPEESTQSKVEYSRVNKKRTTDVVPKKETNIAPDVFQDVWQLEKLYRQNEKLISAVSENYSLTKDQVLSSLEKFTKELESSGRLQETWKEYAAYFKNCLSKKKYSQPQKKVMKRPTDKNFF